MPDTDSRIAATLDSSTSPLQPHILVVEGHAELRMLLCDWLGAVFPHGAFMESPDGKSAIALARSNPPDLVLIDIDSPGINGVEATRAIRHAAPRAPVVILTIHEESDYQAAARQAGAAGCVFKRKMHRDLIPLLQRLLSDPLSAKDSVT